MPDNHKIATVNRKGLLPKLSGSATDFVNGAGAWAVPAGSSSDPSRLGNGSTSAPSYSFTNDTDTGIYLFSDGTLGVAVAGSVWSLLGNGFSIFSGVLQADGGDLFGGGAINAIILGSSGIGFCWNTTGDDYIAVADASGAQTMRWNLTDKHSVHVGTAPTITAGGGTSPTIAGKDEAFTVTAGTGGLATSVEVTFANAFTNAPQCSANHQGAILVLRCVSLTTKVTIDAATPFTASGKIDVICRGYE